MDEERTRFSILSKTFDILMTTLNRYYNKWVENTPDSQTSSSKNISITLCEKVRKTILSSEDEDVIRETILYYARK